MTKHFSKWAAKQKIPKQELANALTEVVAGNFEANLGGYLYKKKNPFCGSRQKQWRTNHYLL
ncbi:MAG: type II toxin-antitoxin system RelE/ParE family toxin [Desulfobacterales bacterium]